MHLARTIAHKVRVTDRAEIWGDFKAVYRTESAEDGQKALDVFCSKWKAAYTKVTKALLQNPNIFTFYSFPKPI